jgi:hypothetical protein
MRAKRKWTVRDGETLKLGDEWELTVRMTPNGRRGVEIEVIHMVPVSVTKDRCADECPSLQTST